MDLDGDGKISIDEFKKIEDVETCFEHADRSNAQAELSNKPIGKARGKVDIGGLSDATKKWLATEHGEDWAKAQAAQKPKA